MQKISLLFILAIIVNFVSAQNGKIQFEQTTFDFGNIKEEGDSAIAKFVFTNVGDINVQVINVMPTCGCTTKDFSQGVIKPGEKGYIYAIYHTLGRPGVFNKTLVATFDGLGNPNITLNITGNVIEKPKSIGDTYLTTLGNLKLMSNQIRFGEIKNTDIITDTMKIFNNGDDNLIVTFPKTPPHLKINVVPNVLEKDSEGLIIVTYNANKQVEYGRCNDFLEMHMNDTVSPIKIFIVSASISEDFSKMSPKQISKAAVLKFDDNIYHFGLVKSGAVIKFTYNFTNEGKRPLIIRKITPECDCTTIELNKKEFKKGEKGEIKVSFDTNGYKGNITKIINIISNDPSKPNMQIYLNGDVL